MHSRALRYLHRKSNSMLTQYATFVWLYTTSTHLPTLTKTPFSTINPLQLCVILFFPEQSPQQTTSSFYRGGAVLGEVLHHVPGLSAACI